MNIDSNILALLFPVFFFVVLYILYSKKGRIIGLKITLETNKIEELGIKDETTLKRPLYSSSKQITRLYRVTDKSGLRYYVLGADTKTILSIQRTYIKITDDFLDKLKKLDPLNK